MMVLITTLQPKVRNTVYSTASKTTMVTTIFSSESTSITFCRLRGQCNFPKKLFTTAGWLYSRVKMHSQHEQVCLHHFSCKCIYTISSMNLKNGPDNHLGFQGPLQVCTACTITGVTLRTAIFTHIMYEATTSVTSALITDTPKPL